MQGIVGLPNSSGDTPALASPVPVWVNGGLTARVVLGIVDIEPHGLLIPLLDQYIEVAILREDAIRRPDDVVCSTS